MVWPFLMGGSVAICAASLLVRDGRAFRVSALIFSGFMGARVIMNTPISGEYRDVVFAAMWVMVAMAFPHGKNGIRDWLFTARMAVLGCGLCSLWGRIGQYDMYFGSPPYMTADILLITAMLLTGWSLRNELVHRISNALSRIFGVVGDYSVRSGRPVADAQSIQFGKAGWEPNPPEVRRDG